MMGSIKKDYIHTYSTYTYIRLVKETPFCGAEESQRRVRHSKSHKLSRYKLQCKNILLEIIVYVCVRKEQTTPELQTGFGALCFSINVSATKSESRPLTLWGQRIV